jgi:hypothetical protein
MRKFTYLLMVACMKGYARIYHRGMTTPTVQRLSSRLKLRHFALLAELDRHRSISRTAVQLNLAQPTVTRALASLLRQLPDAITILPDDIATEVALASGARVLPQRLQWNLPPVGMVRREDVGSAELIDGIAASIRGASPAA